MRYYVWEKTMGKWTAMYGLAYEAYLAVIRGWIRQCMKWLENCWISGSEICLVATPYKFLPFPHTLPRISLIVSPVSLGISHVSPGAPHCFLISLLNRSSCDNKTNLYGRRLLKLCNNHNLKIVNGQTPEERIGNCTWFTGEGTSVSAYLLVEKF